MGLARFLAAPATWPAAGRIARALEAERERAALWLPVLLLLGTVAYFVLPAEPDPAWLLAVPSLAVACVLGRARMAVLWPATACLAFSLGFASPLLHSRLAAPWPELPRTAVVLEGVVVDLDRLEDGRRVRLAGVRWEGGEPIARELRVRLARADATEVVPGDRIRVRALVRTPLPPAYPGAWDLRRSAWFGNLGGSGWALGPVVVLGRAEKGSAWVASLRAAIEARAAELLPGSVGAIAAALITGSQGAIGEADLQAMRDSGLAHLLSVSGLHVAVAFGLVFFAVRKALALWAAFHAPGLVAKRPAALVGLGAVLFYGALTGWDVPVIRSVAMAGLVAIAILVDRRGITMRALALAAVLVVAIDPVAVVGPSFQMSFAAVLALIACWRAVQPAMPDWRERLGAWSFLLAVIGSALTSVVAGLATAPFALAHFGRAALWSVPANALAVPITSFVSMPAAVVALLLMPFGLDAPAWAALGWSVEAVLSIAHAFAAMPAAAPAVPLLPRWGLGLCVAGLLLVCLCTGRWRLGAVVPFGIGLFAWVAATPPQVLLSADARHLAVATGQGLVLKGPPGFTPDQWLRLAGERAPVPWPAPAGSAAGLVCAPDGCRAFGGALFVPTRVPIEPDSCGGARLVVAAEPVRRACPQAVVVDRFTAWRDGAVAAWIEPEGVRVLTDRQWRGERPWVAPPPVPRWQAEAGGLPLAPSE